MRISDWSSDVCSSDLEVAIFEAVHGSAPDIAGKGVANPCALLLGAAQMLDHLGMAEKATKLREAIVATLEARDSLTPDLGGPGSTMSFARAIAAREIGIASCREGVGQSV